MARWQPEVQVKIYRGARYQQEDAYIWRRLVLLKAVFSTCHHQLWGTGKGVCRWGVLVGRGGPWHCGRVGGGVLHLEASRPLGPGEISVWGSCTSKAPHLLNRLVFWLSTIRNTLSPFIVSPIIFIWYPFHYPEIRTTTKTSATPKTETTSTTPRLCTATVTPLPCRTPGTCPTIDSVYPSKLQRTTARTLNVKTSLVLRFLYNIFFFSWCHNTEHRVAKL